MSVRDLSGYPSCDNDCDLLGWIEVLASGPEHDLHLSVPPDTDFDDTFPAWCHDAQEMIRVNGWLWTFEEVVACRSCRASPTTAGGPH